MYKINDRTIFQNTQKQHMVRPQRLVSVNMEFSRWMPVVTAVAVGGYGCWVRMVGLDAEVLWVSSSDAVSEAPLSDTSRKQVADPSSICLSAWGQTA